MFSLEELDYEIEMGMDNFHFNLLIESIFANRTGWV